jgi:hypothetical protein
VKDAKYAEVAAQFDEAVAVTKLWPIDPEQQAVRSFLRAYLAYLSGAKAPP